MEFDVKAVGFAFGFGPKNEDLSIKMKNGNGSENRVETPQIDDHFVGKMMINHEDVPSCQTNSHWLSDF